MSDSSRDKVQDKRLELAFGSDMNGHPEEGKDIRGGAAVEPKVYTSRIVLQFKD